MDEWGGDRVSWPGNIQCPAANELYNLDNRSQQREQPRRNPQDHLPAAAEAEAFSYDLILREDMTTLVETISALL